MREVGKKTNTEELLDLIENHNNIKDADWRIDISPNSIQIKRAYNSVKTFINQLEKFSYNPLDQRDVQELKKELSELEWVVEDDPSGALADIDKIFSQGHGILENIAHDRGVRALFKSRET